MKENLMQISLKEIPWTNALGNGESSMEVYSCREKAKNDLTNFG